VEIGRGNGELIGELPGHGLRHAPGRDRIGPRVVGVVEDDAVDLGRRLERAFALAVPIDGLVDDERVDDAADRTDVAEGFDAVPTGALYTTRGTPRAKTARTAATTSATTSAAGRPSARARSVEMPWTALACSGISMPGSAIQAPWAMLVPSASIRPTCAVTMRAVSTSMPVVSRSKTPSAFHQSAGTGPTGIGSPDTTASDEAVGAGERSVSVTPRVYEAPPTTPCPVFGTSPTCSQKKACVPRVSVTRPSSSNDGNWAPPKRS
jgi:hypothetical protein